MEAYTSTLDLHTYLLSICLHNALESNFGLVYILYAYKFYLNLKMFFKEINKIKNLQIYSYFDYTFEILFSFLAFDKTPTRNMFYYALKLIWVKGEHYTWKYFKFCQ